MFTTWKKKTENPKLTTAVSVLGVCAGLYPEKSIVTFC